MCTQAGGAVWRVLSCAPKSSSCSIERPSCAGTCLLSEHHYEWLSQLAVEGSLGCMLLKPRAVSAICTHQWSKVQQDLHEDMQQETLQQIAVLFLPGRHCQRIFYVRGLPEAANAM